MKFEPWHISVLIPARDEEVLLPRCLRSVMAAREALRGAATCDVIVVVDCSMDATFELARAMVGEEDVVMRCDAGIVGEARAAAARMALQRNDRKASRVWLANTDADCVVPRTWLLDQLEMAEAGAHAIAGIVDVDSFDEHEACVPERFRTSYTLRADGTHPHIHGANMGVRADAYLRVGGWAQLSTAEDHDLWGRLRAANAVQVSPVRLSVLTSGRRLGRAPSGFAGALASHNEVRV